MTLPVDCLFHHFAELSTPWICYLRWFAVFSSILCSYINFNLGRLFHHFVELSTPWIGFLWGDPSTQAGHCPAAQGIPHEPGMHAHHVWASMQPGDQRLFTAPAAPYSCISSPRSHLRNIPCDCTPPPACASPHSFPQFFSCFLLIDAIFSLCILVHHIVFCKMLSGGLMLQPSQIAVQDCNF